MNKLPCDQRARILMALIEGNSIASVCRMTGAAKMTVLSLIREVGKACRHFHDTWVRDLPTTKVQCDEVWSFCHAKDKNLPAELKGRDGFGSIWTWTAIDADSKLLVSWLAGSRSTETAMDFMSDLASRLGNRVQLTSDGFASYVPAVAKVFGKENVDYAELMKLFASGSRSNTNPTSAASRYSPGHLVTYKKEVRFGTPDFKEIATSYMERWNLTLRMQNRRFTRLTNAFSKKFENHCHMLAITVVYYNFCRKHQSLKGQTPAMAAGLTDYRWTAADLLSLDMWSEAEAA